MTDKPLFSRSEAGEPANHATQEALGDMKNRSELTSKYLGALKRGNISDVLQDSIREHLVAAMPPEQRHAYNEENPDGPKHKVVNQGVQKAETIFLEQAMQHAPGLSQVKNVEEAVRLLQNPREATTQQWINLGFTGVTHGMIPKEISEPLSKSLADQSNKFFTGTGTGTLADCQVHLQAELVALQPTIHKLGTQATETGKKIGGFFKANVYDAAKKKLTSDDKE
jgi:hypothetical protein